MKKGFTLIELLVVVAIIGILASVVLASLGTARQKGKNAAIKAELANARAQAEIYYDSNNNSYAGVCADNPESIKKIFDAAVKLSGGQKVCSDSQDSWVAAVELGSCFCADSTGVAKEIASCSYSTSVSSCAEVEEGGGGRTFGPRPVGIDIPAL